MMRLRFSCGACLVLLAIGAVSVHADEAAVKKLADAVRHVDAGQYESAEALLASIDPNDLSEDTQKLQLQRYLLQTQTALKEIANARDDMEVGAGALDSGDRAAATEAFRRVVANRYAPASLREKAAGHLATLNAAKPTPSPARSHVSAPAMSDTGQQPGGSWPARASGPPHRPPAARRRTARAGRPRAGR